jgi:TRAP-type C4-dicarboxylate transport system permease small subunit
MTAVRRRWEDGVYRLPEVVAAVDLLLLMLLVAADVAGRYLFNKPISGGYELVQLLMGVLVFSALPVISRTNEHITIGLLDPWFTGLADRLRRVFVNVFSAAALAFVSWRLGVHAGKLGANGDTTPVLALPLAPIGWFMTAMASLSVVSLLVLTVRVARKTA